MVPAAATGNGNNKRSHAAIFPAGSPPLDDVVDEIIAELHRAVTTKQRITVLRRVRQVLEEDRGLDRVPVGGGDAVVRALLHGGILQALVLQLGYVLQRQITTIREMEDLCHVLHVVLRRIQNEAGGDSVRQRSRRGESGAGERSYQEAVENRHFVELLAAALNRQDSPATTRCLCSAVHALSTTSTGSEQIVNCREMLVQITNILRGRDTGTMAFGTGNSTAVVEALGALKNITYYAADDRKRLLQVPSLLSALAELAYLDDEDGGAVDEDSLRIRERLSSVFRNFALSPDCRVTLGQDEPGFLDALVHLLSSAESGCHGLRQPRVTRNVLTVLHNLAMDDRNSCLLLIFHGDGILLGILKRLMVHPQDSVVRKRSTRTLRLLTNESSAPLLVHRADLMELLSHQALTDPNQAVRTEAAEAFAKCAGLVKAGQQPHYQSVLQALIQLAKSPYGGGASTQDVLARALKEQAEHRDNRIPMVRCTELLSVFARIASGSSSSHNTETWLAPNTAREDACRALLSLSEEDVNLKVLASNDEILNALVDSARHVPQRNANLLTRKYALQTLCRLTSDATNRGRLANHEHLVEALIQYASTAPDFDETKSNVKKAILLLVSEL